MIFIGSRAAVALFVEELLASLGFDWQSITITQAEKSEDCYVSIAIDTSLAAIVVDMATDYSLQPITISYLPTQAG